MSSSPDITNAVDALSSALDLVPQPLRNRQQFEGALRDYGAELDRLHIDVLVKALGFPALAQKLSGAIATSSEPLTGLADWLEHQHGFNSALADFAEAAWAQKLGLNHTPRAKLVTAHRSVRRPQAPPCLSPQLRRPPQCRRNSAGHGIAR